MPANKLEQHTGTFAYRNKKIPFTYWSHTADGQAPDAVLFLGAGGVGKIPEWIARRAGPGIVVVQGLPHWEADPEPKEVERFSTDYIHNAFRVVRAHFNVPAMHVLGNSQAAPGTISAIDAMHKAVRNVALIQPLGFTSAAFGDSMEERLVSFRKRIYRTLLQFPRSFINDPRYLLIALIAHRAIRREPSQESYNIKYGVGISYDSSADCRRAATKIHAQGGSFTLLLGQEDRIFPPHEILETLKLGGIQYVDTVMLPAAPHVALATRRGGAILRKALKILRSPTTRNIDSALLESVKSSR